MPKDASVERVNAQASRLSRTMHGADVGVETVAALDEAAMECLGVNVWSLADLVETRLELLGNMTPRQLGAVAVQAQVPETRMVQAIKDDVESGALLGHEQHGLAARDHLRDQVRDRLALACARWAA